MSNSESLRPPPPPPPQPRPGLDLQPALDVNRKAVGASAVQWSLAGDPMTPASTLAELAMIPELQSLIAQNPAASEGLLVWISTNGHPAAQIALAQRRNSYSSTAYADRIRASGVPAATGPTAGIAIAAMVCAFLLPILGLALGIVAAVTVKPPARGQGLGIGAIIVSVLVMSFLSSLLLNRS